MASSAGARLPDILVCAAIIIAGCSSVNSSTIGPSAEEATHWMPSNSTFWNPTVTGASTTIVARPTPTATGRFTKGPQPERPNAIKVEMGSCDAGGRCTCSITVPTPCTADEQYRELVNIKQRLVEVDSILNGSFIRKAFTNITAITARIQTLEQSINKQSVSVSLSEIEILRKELQLVSSVVRALEGKVDGTVVASITKEMDAILLQINFLESGNPVAAQGKLEQQIEELRTRLAKCKEESQSLTGSPFPGDTVSVNETNYRSCPASPDLRIGTQTVHKFRSGVWYSWFRDVQPSDGQRSKYIYEARNPTNNGYLSLYEWQDYADYSSARSESLLKTRCPYPSHLGTLSGRKYIMLGGYFYYHDVSSNLVVKMDTMTCKRTKWLSLPIENNAYLNGDSPYADINYDETGMYVVYTNAAVSGELVIAKIDPVNMTLIKTWETGRRKATLSNVFFICGRMYTTDSHSARHLTGKQFGYDTNKGAEFLVSMDVESRLGSVVQLAYNPRDRMIFGIDNYHSVSYDIYFD